VNGRTSGLQVAISGIVAELERWRDQMPPREYVELIAILLLWLQAEQRRLEGTRWSP